MAAVFRISCPDTCIGVLGGKRNKDKGAGIKVKGIRFKVKVKSTIFSPAVMNSGGLKIKI
jgi:hypothetical protein